MSDGERKSSMTKKTLGKMAELWIDNNVRTRLIVFSSGRRKIRRLVAVYACAFTAKSASTEMYYPLGAMTFQTTSQQAPNEYSDGDTIKLHFEKNYHK